MGSITWVDWSIWLVYFTCITLLLWVYRSAKTDPHFKYFLPGFFIKVAGGVAFAVIYVYYYGFGDTFLYHRGAKILSQALIDHPGDYFRLLSSANANLPADLSYFSQSIHYSKTYEEWTMVKLLSPVSLIAFQSYLVTTLFMSVLSFIGGWKLFQVFRDLLPEYEKYAYWAVFLAPSVVFWGSGIMKDTVTLFAINYLIYALYFGFFKKGFSFRYLLISAVLIYIIVSLKAYIVLAFLPGVLLAFYVLFKKRIRNVVLRWMAGPFIFLVLIAVSYFGLGQITSSSTKYRAENIQWQVKGFHSWHTDVGGSSYNLGDVEYTPVGVARKIPAALNVTFFRPYLWEARNPVVLIGALESLVFLGLFVFILYRYRFRFMRELRKEPLLYGLLIYCLVFGFAVGFTSYNFGALARYKIPIMSLFAFILFFLYARSKELPADKTES